jgi:Cu(I)/Ag(I) efflux system membrane fusion protein
VDRSTAVDDKQAADLTLTLTKASVRPVQTWVRTSGKIDKTRKTIIGYMHPRDAALIKVGQRVRAFPPESKSSMYQARVTRIVPQGARVMLEATLSSSGREQSTNYIMEVVVDRGEFLSVPNEAIIEEGDKHVVYLQHHPGMYVPQEIHTGVQGELYTQVLHGLNEGDQVVTFGSFFVDSEYKLKSSGESPAGNEHQHHH